MFVLLFGCFSIFTYGYAQDKDMQYYKYNIVSFSGGEKNIKVTVDDGIEKDKLRNAVGKKLIFKTHASVLMYLVNEGWELFDSGSIVTGSASAIGTSPYWIMRKPCTKEEFEAIIQKGVKE